MHIDAVPLWAVFPIVLLVGALSMESGFRLARWRLARKKHETEGPTGVMVGSMLGLLGFILAFTFGLAATQFDARRQAVLHDANAVGTAYLRAGLLPEPHARTVRTLLREYVEVRETSVREQRIAEGIARAVAIQSRLWSEAQAAAATLPQQVPTGLFIQALNDVIDQHTLRVAAGLYSRVPNVVWLTLVGLTVVGMGSVGFQTGLSERPRSVAGLGLAAVFGVVIYLVADIDRPLAGSIQVQRWAMEELLRSMDASPESSPPPRP